MPEVKELKELKVAGSATEDAKPVCDFVVQWHLTEQCNLRCRHCYQEGGGKDEMSLSEVREAVGEIREMFADWAKTYGLKFSPSFNVTGGEPFLRTDLFQILADMRESGFEVHLLSNGTLIDKKKADALSSLGVSGVQVSLEGPEDIHDRIRGRGSFAAAVRGARNLLDSGLEVTFNATLSRLNAASVGHLVSTASSIGVQRFGFSRLVPSGRGADLLGEMLTASEVIAVYEQLLSLDINNLAVVTGDPLAGQMQRGQDADQGDTPLGGCAAGVAGLTLLPDGTITPCRRLNIPIGNIRSDSVRKVWANSEVLNALRDRGRYQGKCRDCPRWAECRGCRAIAYAFSAARGRPDFLAEDPQCFHAV